MTSAAASSLADAAAGGDLRATQELVLAVTGRVQRVVRAVLGSWHPDVDDVTQQALIAFVDALPTFRGECEPVHFASKIAAAGAMSGAIIALHPEELMDADAREGLGPEALRRLEAHCARCAACRVERSLRAQFGRTRARARCSGARSPRGSVSLHGPFERGRAAAPD